MTWIQLSLKEWRRRPLRTGVTAAGVAIAIAAVFSLLAFERGYKKGFAHELDRLGAHILVVPKGCPYDAASMALHGASWPCYLRESYLTEVRSVPGIATAAPIFMAAIPVEEGGLAIYLGVTENIQALRRAWRIRGVFPVAEKDLLVGSEVARRSGWRLGDEVSLPGLPGQRGRVAGILERTGGPDDSFIHLKLRTAQNLFRHSQELTHILIRLAAPDQMDRVAAQLRGCDAGLSMNVVPLSHVFKTIQSMVNSTRILFLSISMVALLLAGAGVGNTILTAVMERRREIGILRALGASRGDVFRLVCFETVQVCLLGAVAGVMAAFCASPGIESWARARLPFAPAGTLIRWEWTVAAACVGCAVLLGMVAALLPAWRAARVSPMIAIRDSGGAI